MSICELKAQVRMLSEPLTGHANAICQENLGFEDFILADGFNYIDETGQIYMVKKESIWDMQANTQAHK